MPRVCKIENCRGAHEARGWCNKHYQRFLKRGDPLLGVAHFRDPEEAFLARTEPLAWSGCIIWTASRCSGGYGLIWTGERQERAHRYAWQRAKGPIPSDRVLDHTCFERSCVNVDHLRLATAWQNGQSLSGANPGRDLPRGVHRTRNGERYEARVRFAGRDIYVGTYDTPGQASADAASLRAELFGEFAGKG